MRVSFSSKSPLKKMGEKQDKIPSLLKANRFKNLLF
jgi:hypothetical protein